MAIDKKEGTSIEEKTKRLILGFKDNNQVRGSLNEIFLLVVTTTMNNFKISRVLIEGMSLCAIMYIELFKKLCLSKEKLSL